MKKAGTLLLLAVLIMSLSCREKEHLTTFILVRHAEKGDDGTDDPDLTMEGQARARRLAFMLKDTPLMAVYSTNFKRTRNTVQDAADAQGLEVQLYEPLKPNIILDMLRKHEGGTVLVAGHSNTIPWTANMLLGREAYEDYAESEYGTILIVSVAKTNDLSASVRINY